MKKTPIALALAAMTGVGGTLVSTSAQAVNMAERDIGDALIFPYYTARDGWNSLFNITNASANTVALKVRFRESYNSRDVLDFNLVMSPYDVWTGWVAPGPNGPRLMSKDSSCTSPLWQVDGNGVSYFDFTNAGYSGAAADGGPTDIDRAAKGHLTVLMMGAAFPGQETATQDGSPLFPAVYYANHDTLNCANVDGTFLKDTRPSDIEACLYGDHDPSDGNPAAECDFGRNANALKGNFSLIDTGNGIGAGGEATTLANYRTGWNLSLIPLTSAVLDMAAETPEAVAALSSYYTNAVTAQNYPYFLEPTLDSADPIAPLTVDDPPIFLGIPELASIIGFGIGLEAIDFPIALANLRFGRGVDAVSFALRNASLINEWSTNAATGASTDWAVTYPTKSFYVDIGTNENAAINPARYNCEVNADKNWDCRFGLWANLWDLDNYDYLDMNPVLPWPWVFDLNATILGGTPPTPDFTDPGHPGLKVEVFSEVFDGQSCDEVTYNIWDREEGGATSGGTSISPAPPQPTDSLCYETNVLAFGNQDSALGSNLAQGVDVSVLSSGASAGWMRLGQADLSAFLASIEAAVSQESPEEHAEDMPTLSKFFMPGVGFAFKQRNFGDPSRNYGQLMDHSGPKAIEQVIMENGNPGNILSIGPIAHGIFPIPIGGVDAP